ncbi:hypothetical protein SISNIDRAFT_473951 [Sistotremastrum niveocremeum HHB9708]|uniref:C3H1-type domain-containing protein n=2 Tax=Sistotremastraceae TaxID=3402574 RepID=A0A164VVC4_9AGAM|nr:hypothetical protein SISNIDRAFT_473951 [Sistotremastrum niveocremeum HHB9708]KZT43168.1 hypothetical protein SISSUDRAFT_1069031 [Sistotremastrum suecicum HHB10207 ss-3]
MTKSLKFPHTRAMLAAISREYKVPEPVSTTESDTDGENIDDRAGVDSATVRKVAALLQEENEDELKQVLKDRFGAPDNDEVLDEHVLNLMHKHRDDQAGVPFLFLTPTRRPISRPSSRASSHSFRVARPETPNSMPSSPLLFAFRRPHTPLASPMNPAKEGGSYMSAGGMDSPTLANAQLAAIQASSSSPPSPLSSPRLLNAKASEFRPSPRPLSAAGSNSSLIGLRNETPSPDLWAHKSSNLAIAAPLVPESSLYPPRTSSSLARHSVPDEDEEDEFDPFATKPNRVFHPIPPASDVDSSNSTSTSSQSRDSQFDEILREELPPDDDDSHAAMLTDGMTPFDVLSSVFGATLAPSELEEALERNGFDFERAMAWLVDSAMPQASPHLAARPSTFNSTGRVIVVPRENFPRAAGRGAYPGSASPRGASRFPGGRVGMNRVCRYFLAGECMRADCRFSHDLERALCRFWLRGACAKGESCEFLHHLPKEVDVNSLTNAMASHDLTPDEHNPGMATPPLDDFPSLGDRESGDRRPHVMDPGRSRFAAAVKKQPSVVPNLNPAKTFINRNHGLSRSASSESINSRPTVIAPRPSPRLKLRPATLLPTLPTGESISNLYMTYRSRALQLGAARNACLSRAADAWRRGDGAAAKRFSREGQDLNLKMGVEAGEAALKLIRERAKQATEAVRQRDMSWSDDPGDRLVRGRSCGGGLGVFLGIASRDAGSDSGSHRLSAEERTEACMDLHGLHASEASEAIETFLLALEKEYFHGLAYLIVGEEKHTGTQDVARGAARARLATGVREWLHKWGYPWMERDGIIIVDPLTHIQ